MNIEKTPEKAEYIHIRIEPELKKEFFELCEKQSVNPSELLRKKIKNYIKNNKKGVDTSSRF
jgi:metal-responsive CopG/Arc/MetJ family transcriptional regulator